MEVYRGQPAMMHDVVGVPFVDLDVAPAFVPVQALMVMSSLPVSTMLAEGLRDIGCSLGAPRTRRPFHGCCS
jgi:hypothetical protein